MNNIICHKVIAVTKKGAELESDGKKIYIDFDCCAKTRKFLDMQKAIVEAGYTSYDLS